MCSGANGKRDRYLAISLHTRENINKEGALIYVHATSYMASYTGEYDAKTGVTTLHSLHSAEHQVNGNE